MRVNDSGLPAPAPDGLSGEALDEFRRVERTFAHRGRELEEGDRSVLFRHCLAWEAFVGLQVVYGQCHPASEEAADLEKRIRALNSQLATTSSQLCIAPAYRHVKVQEAERAKTTEEAKVDAALDSIRQARNARQAASPGQNLVPARRAS